MYAFCNFGVGTLGYLVTIFTPVTVWEAHAPGLIIFYHNQLIQIMRPCTECQDVSETRNNALIVNSFSVGKLLGEGGGGSQDDDVVINCV